MRIVTLFLALVLPSAGYAQAARLQPDQRTDLAPPGRFALDLEIDILNSAKLDQDNLSGTESDSAGVITGVLNPNVSTGNVEFSSRAAWLRGACPLYGAADGPFAVEGYILMGMADLSLKGDVVRPGNPDQDFDVEGKNGPGYGLGVRSRLLRQDSFRLIADMSWRRSDHDAEIGQVSRLNLDLAPGETSSQDFKAIMKSFRFSLVGSLVLPAGTIAVVPYAGFHVSIVDVNVNGTQSFFDPAFDRTQSIRYGGSKESAVGLTTGVEAAFTPSLGAFLEFRLLDETAVTVGGGWTF